MATQQNITTKPCHVSEKTTVPLGMIYCTSTISALCLDNLPRSMAIQKMVQAHQTKNWGIVCPEDAEANELALDDGSRILSAYLDPNFDEKIYVITYQQGDDQEDGPAHTIIMFASEY